MKSEVAFVLLFYGATVLAHHCHVGKGDQTSTKSCNSDGCAVVLYEGASQVEYFCVSDLRYNLLFTQLECSHHHQVSSCYDTSSSHLPNFWQRLTLRRETVGQILSQYGIPKYCCCSGHKCSSANEDIHRFMGIHHHHHKKEYIPESPIDSSVSVSVSFFVILFSFLLFF